MTTFWGKLWLRRLTDEKGERFTQYFGDAEATNLIAQRSHPTRYCHSSGRRHVLLNGSTHLYEWLPALSLKTKKKPARDWEWKR